MNQAQERHRLRLLRQPSGRSVRVLIVNADAVTARVVRSAFHKVGEAVLEFAPSARAAMRMLSAEPHDLVAVDPATSPGGMALLNHIKDHYRWTATLVATPNQEPQFLRDLIRCRIDGLLFRPVTGPAEFIEQALLLAQEASDRRHRQQKRVLAIGAHPDDVEIGCGGALAKHFADYDLIHILTLSRGAAGGDANIRLAEAHNAAAMVGAQLRIENLRDTDINAGAETIALIEAAIQDLQATDVYTHSADDTHQDHRAINAATLVAARNVPNVYCYQSPSSTLGFSPHRFVDITHYIDKKIDLIAAYKSQVERMVALEPDVILSTARYWGRFAGYVLAEPLQIVRQRDSRSALDGAREAARQAAASITDGAD